MKPKFEVGDRVIATYNFERESHDYPIEGLSGTVVRICHSDLVGVMFDEYIDGHACEGEGKDGHGWNIPPKCLDYEKINNWKELIQ